MKRFIVTITAVGLLLACHRTIDEEQLTKPSTEGGPTSSAVDMLRAGNQAVLQWAAYTGKTAVPIEEATRTALETAQQLRGSLGITTARTAPLKIKSVEVISGNEKHPYNAATARNGKALLADLYLFNFENDQGYVIAGAQRYLPSVLAYSDTGHLGDTITNPGQAILLERMALFIEQQKADFEARKEELKRQAEEAIFKKLPKATQDSLIAEGWFDKNGKRVVKTHSTSKITVPHPWEERLCMEDELVTTEDIWTTDYVKAPLLKTLWDQSSAYNEKVPWFCPETNSRPPVGCVAVAVGQILAYHKKPTVFDGRVMHWDEMTNEVGGVYLNISPTTAKDDIQYLLANLGLSEFLNTKYGCKYGSGSTISNAVKTFHLLGYSNATIEMYNGEKITNEIKNNRPVYARGCSIMDPNTYSVLWWKIKLPPTYDKCHAWVLDGYVCRTHKTTSYYRGTCAEANIPIYGVQSTGFVHNNFGWGGRSNGWYYMGVFNTVQGPSAPSDTYNRTTEKEGERGNYKYENEIIINIY